MNIDASFDMEFAEHRVRIGGLRKLIWYLSLVMAVALGQAACSTSKPHQSGPGHAPAAAYPGLELDDGKKWVVVPPMMAHLRNLEKAVQDFERAPAHEHAALAAEIQEHLGRLVTNCTMEGKAHDQLHKWLLPFLALSTDYSNAAAAQLQRQKYREIKDALVVFNAHFE